MLGFFMVKDEIFIQISITVLFKNDYGTISQLLWAIDQIRMKIWFESWLNKLY